MRNGLYLDREGWLWYVRDGEGQAIDWIEGVGPPVPEVALRMIFGPMDLIDETTRETT